MRFLRKLFYWLVGIIVGLVALAYITGNGHLVRGMRYTYLIGRAGPEIDDRDFFPYTTIPADAPQPWAHGSRYGKLELNSDQEQALLKNSTVGFLLIQDDSLIFENYFGGWNADSVIIRAIQFGR